jgi:quercetin dioxygenase-like cupin family protein
MNILEIASLKLPGGGSPRFEGGNFGATVSFFVVTSSPGNGADKHRHPYEEVFVILEGSIEVIVGGELQMIESGNIVVIPPNTWHEFKNRSSQNALMVNIHPTPKMIQEDWSET